MDGVYKREGRAEALNVYASDLTLWVEGWDKKTAGK